MWSWYSLVCLLMFIVQQISVKHVFKFNQNSFPLNQLWEYGSTFSEAQHRQTTLGYISAGVPSIEGSLYISKRDTHTLMASPLRPHLGFYWRHRTLIGIWQHSECWGWTAAEVAPLRADRFREHGRALIGRPGTHPRHLWPQQPY